MIDCFRMYQRIIVATFLSIFASFLLSSAGKSSKSPYFILPFDNQTIIANRYVDNDILGFDRYDLPEKAIYATDGEKYVAVFETDRLNLTVHNIEEGTSIKAGSPFRIAARAVLVHNNVVYIGGFREGPLVLRYSMQKEKWETLAVPSEPRHLNRKAIDALLTDGETLYAVDNIVFPKYVIIYKIEENKTVYSHYEQLRNNSSYESIKYAYLTPKYIATYSTSMNHGLASNHITVYRKGRFNSSFSVHGVTRLRPGTQEYELNIYDDFALVGNKLVIINRNKGLGVLEIEDDFFRTRRNYRARINYDELKPDLSDDDEMISLKAIPGTDKAVLGVRHIQGHISYQILEL